MAQRYMAVPGVLALLTALVPASGAGPIVQQAYVKASNTDANDQFGTAVAVSGDIAVVGSYVEASTSRGVNGNQNNTPTIGVLAGAAYIFIRDGAGVWSQHAYLKASNTGLAGQGNRFGWSVAVSGNTVVVGAPLESSNATGVNGNQLNNTASSAGAVYVFVRDAGGYWSQQAYLKASNTGSGDQFGLSVAVSGDTIVVGAPEEDSNAVGVDGDQSNNGATQAGAAYVFVRAPGGTTWTQQAYLKASNTDASDRFGGSVAVSDNTVVVGTRFEDGGTGGVNGDQSDNSATNSGAAYVFVRPAGGTTWSQQAYLKASNPDASDNFGSFEFGSTAVAVSGDTVVVGAYNEDSNATGVNGDQSNNSAIESGAAYVFVRNGTTWSQQAYLKASNTGTGTTPLLDADQFGCSVAVSGDTVVVGANHESSISPGINGDQNNNNAPGAGAAYLFVRPPGGATWSQQAYVKASSPRGGANIAEGPEFGNSVAAADGTMVIGARLEDSGATGVNGPQGPNTNTPNSGAMYVFTLTDPVPPCPADFNGSGTISVQDIFDFLAAYFAGC